MKEFMYIKEKRKNFTCFCEILNYFRLDKVSFNDTSTIEKSSQLKDLMQVRTMCNDVK